MPLIAGFGMLIHTKSRRTKGSINLKRLKAGWDENYLAELLQGSAF